MRHSLSMAFEGVGTCKRAYSYSHWGNLPATIVVNCSKTSLLFCNWANMHQIILNIYQCINTVPFQSLNYLLLPPGSTNPALLMNSPSHGLQHAFIIIHTGSCKHSSWADEDWWEYLLIYNACCLFQHGWPRCHGGSSQMTHQVCLVTKTMLFIETC